VLLLLALGLVIVAFYGGLAISPALFLILVLVVVIVAYDGRAGRRGWW